LSLSSISKQRGALISSRLIHPKVIEISLIVFIISSVFCVLRTIGNAFTSQNSFKSAHFPSITGRLARAQIFHNPKTALPSLITAIVFALRVYL
jgi:hypothetical protein